MTCELSHLDGAYVLGSLSPQERRLFEDHLETCTSCGRAVQDLAGLPGLLGRVGGEVLEPPAAPAAGEAPPPTLLPALLEEVRRSSGARRRRATALAGLAAAAAAAVAVGVLTVGGLGGGSTTDAPPDAGRAMVPAGAAAGPLHASLALEPVDWGTRLDLTCSYDSPTGYPPTAAPSYALVVRTRDGRTQRVATWHAVQGRTMHLTGATAASPEQIDSVEVRTLDGRALLRLDS